MNQPRNNMNFGPIRRRTVVDSNRAEKPPVQVTAPSQQPIQTPPQQPQPQAPKQTASLERKLPSAAELAALHHNRKRPAPASTVSPTVSSQVSSQALPKPPVNRKNATNAVLPQKSATRNQPLPLFEDAVRQERAKKGTTKRKRPSKRLVIIAVIIIAIVAAVVIFMATRKKEPELASTFNQPVAAGVDETLAEKASVPANERGNLAPRWISIPKLAIETEVSNISTSSDSMSGPKNIFQVGWDSTSAKPGDSGATVLNGYVHGPNKPGVFYTIKQLVPGDIVKVERRDGKIISYKVDAVKIYDAPKVDLIQARKPAITNKAGLNLVTYSDAMDVKNRYNEQIIVYTSING